MAPFEEILVDLPDGYRAYARYWSPKTPRAAVLYHHGIQSHCGWYESSPARLVEGGCAVLQVDRRGCGRNETDRGHAESVDQLLADAFAARDELARRSGLGDHHVVGVSWGGRLAVAAYVREPARVRSLSLVTPGLFPLTGVSKETQADIGFAMLYEPWRLFDIPLGTPELFTQMPQWHRFFDADELTLHKCTAGFYLASRRMDKIIAKLPQTPAVPVHLLLAGDERIVDNEETASFIRDLYWPHGCITTYPGARHSLEFEPDREHYFKDLAAFISEVQQ